MVHFLKAFILIIVLSVSAQASQYKCYPSKYPQGLEHFFGEGYVLLNVKKEIINFKYFYVNTVLRETTLSIDVNYQLRGIQGGNGKLKDMVAGVLVGGKKDYPGDKITPIHFDQSLVRGESRSGIVGKFVFTGQGYSYDWNICYSQR